MNKAREELFELSHGDVVAWVDPGAAVHVKCVTPHGDPVELNAAEVQALCGALVKLARETDPPLQSSPQKMTARQCEIAAEAYTACLLAQAGYDVLVQYGPNQPHYDLVAVKGERILPISVKGSNTGGWMLAVKYIGDGVSYWPAIDSWLKDQRRDVVFSFVQFVDIDLGAAPRVYVARPVEIAKHLKTQRNEKGHGALHEDYKKRHPKSVYDHKIPGEWVFSMERIDMI